MAEYEYQNGDQIYGPVSQQELFKLAMKGEITADTLITTANGSSLRRWTKATAIKALASIITDKQIESAVEQERTAPKTTYRPEPKGPLTEDDIVRAIARSKSYTTHAVVALLLCTFAILPGFIAAWLWAKDAARTKELTGEDPPGGELLEAVKMLSGILLAVVVMLAVFLILGVVFQAAI